MIQRGLVLADDLTGACAGAVLTAACGIPARVINSYQQLDCPAGIISFVNIGTRDLSTADARTRWDAVLARLRDPLQLADCWISFRIDTTMRGNISVMVQSLSHAVKPAPAMLLSAAYPAHGRTTQAGRVWIDGVPLDQFLRDVHYPPPLESSFVPDILGRKSGGFRLLARRTAPADRPGVVTIADAAREDDLSFLAHALVASNKQWIIFDTGPLTARVLAHGWSGPRRYPAFKLGASAETILLAIGSQTHPTARQIAALRSRRNIRVARSPQEAAAGGLFFLSPAGADPQQIGDQARRFLFEVPSIAATLVVSGGETAAAVCQAVEAGELEPLEQLAPLVALNRVACGPCKGLFVVTKGGLVGDDNVYERIISRLNQLRIGD